MVYKSIGVKKELLFAKLEFLKSLRISNLMAFVAYPLDDMD